MCHWLQVVLLTNNLQNAQHNPNATEKTVHCAQVGLIFDPPLPSFIPLHPPRVIDLRRKRNSRFTHRPHGHMDVVNTVDLVEVALRTKRKRNITIFTLSTRQRARRSEGPAAREKNH